MTPAGPFAILWLRHTPGSESVNTPTETWVVCPCAACNETIFVRQLLPNELPSGEELEIRLEAATLKCRSCQAEAIYSTRQFGLVRL